MSPQSAHRGREDGWLREDRRARSAERPAPDRLQRLAVHHRDGHPVPPRLISLDDQVASDDGEYRGFFEWEGTLRSVTLTSGEFFALQRLMTEAEGPVEYEIIETALEDVHTAQPA
ncbi:MAG: hypothetical protein M3435_06050 [Actinomycetota bacterium]|nr:hypothetical protein [Actinomycetota bacterium]